MADSQDDLLADDLEAFLSGEETVWPPGYTVDGDGDEVTTATLDDAANWTLRRIRRARAELERIERTAAAERARIHAWQEDRSAGPRELIAREEASLEIIARRLVALDPKRKTINLPNGSLKLTAPGAASLVVDDENAFLAWLRENHPDQVTEEVTVTEKWGRNQVKKLLTAVEMSEDEIGEDAKPDTRLEWAHDTASGERVPGVHLESPAADRFTYKPRTDTPAG